MTSMFATGLIVFVTSLTITSAEMEPSYRAAVYAHTPELPPNNVNSRSQAVESMERNLIIYEKQAKNASNQGAQIIVFPEDGLYGFDLTRFSIFHFLEPIPDPQSKEHTPCTDDKFENLEVLKRLSCIARDNNIYVVANMGDIQPCWPNMNCPDDGHYQYNTDVVFDNKGVLVARYHKRTLFNEPMFDNAFDTDSQAERITFNTDFAGLFGVFTCFDILFRDPAVVMAEQPDVKNFVFPTAWINSYPFLDAVGFHSAWARRHGVNLLAANLQYPPKGFTGTGVYTASGPVRYYRDEHADSGGELVVVDVPAIKREKDTPFENKIRGDIFKLVHVNEPSGNASVCMKNTCCWLSYNRSEQGNGMQRGNFAFGAFQGEHYSNSAKKGWNLEVCVLVHCDDNDASSCGSDTRPSYTNFSFIMTGRFSSEATKYVYPEVLVSSEGHVALTSSNEWDFQQDATIVTRGRLTKPLLTASLYARDYSLDRLTKPLLTASLYARDYSLDQTRSTKCSG